jgi:hypothetical protein
MNTEYEILDVTLDQETEFVMVENFVKTFTVQSQSVFRDGVANGQDVRLAFYDAWRNEEIIKAITTMVEKKEKLAPTPKLTKTEEPVNHPELTQEQKDYNAWSEAYHREGGMAGGSW